MQHSVEIDVVDFRWDEGNLAHCARHDVTPVVVVEVKDRAPQFFLNDPGQPGSPFMIGPDASGRFWTIIILPAENVGEWKAITGWPSDNAEIRKYNGET